MAENVSLRQGQALGTAVCRGTEEPHQPSRGKSLAAPISSGSVSPEEVLLQWKCSKRCIIGNGPRGIQKIFWALFASQSLYQSAEQRWSVLGSNSHGNTECKAHTCHLNTLSSPVACLLCPQLKELSLKGHLHGIPALKTESSDTSHDTKQPRLSQPARPVRWKIKRGDFFHRSQNGSWKFCTNSCALFQAMLTHSLSMVPHPWAGSGKVSSV